MPASLLLLIALSVPAPPAGDLSTRLDQWFQDYRSQKERAELMQPDDLVRLEQESARDPAMKAQFDQLAKELKATRKRSEADAVAAGSTTLVERLRALSALESYKYADRVRAYADMLSLFDEVARDGKEQDLAMLLDIASFERDVTRPPKEWRNVFAFRPRLVQRESRLALLRAPLPRVVGVLLAAQDEKVARGKKGLDALSRRVVSWEVLASSASSEALSTADAVKISEVALARVRDAAEPEMSRTVAARTVRSLVNERAGFELPDAALDELLDELEGGIATLPPGVIEAYLEVIRSQVRETSIRRLAELLANSKKLSDRASKEVWDALADIAPVSIPYDGDKPRAWLDWYEAEKGEARFQDWFATIDRARAKKDTRSAYEPPRFYGIPVVGHRLVFVIDVSGSMNFPLDENEKTPKIDLAKEQLATAISKLRDYDEFNIVTFDVVVRHMDKAMIPVEKGRKKAFVFVEKLNPSGGTNLFGGLLGAFGLEFAGTVPTGKGIDFPDQIIVLSDGTPTAGDIMDPYAIREELRRINSAGRSRIDAIALGKDADKEFLAGLAKDHGGELMLIGVKEEKEDPADKEEGGGS